MQQATPKQDYALLMTDIQGSTRLLQRLGEDYSVVLKQHHDILRSEIVRAGGEVMDSVGDGFFAMFSNPVNALQASLKAQITMAHHNWPRGISLMVRMGLHFGEVLRTENANIGMSIHKTARICSAGHGGQILLSSSMQSRVQAQLPARVELKHLGQFRLRDIEDTESIFQVVFPGLLIEFPPIRSVDVNNHNLPSDATDFVGREVEKKKILELLEKTRLLTLIGPGGIGKSRLSLQVGAAVLSKFRDGVFFVPLEAVKEPQGIVPTIIKALGSQVDQNSVFESLASHLSQKDLLLILDNFEQLISGAAILGELLKRAPKLKILATSRIVLNLRGEQTYEIPPLRIPDTDQFHSLDELINIEGIDLFVRRAQSANQSFELSPQNAPLVVEIVKQLEGLPLSIELAAIQSRRFTPALLAKSLQNRLKVLIRGPKDLPPRHQVMRNTIAWSYDLLDADEQSLFRRLSIFEGGFTLEAAETINSDCDWDTASLVFDLVDKSLLRKKLHNNEIRVYMLETIREFAMDELRRSYDYLRVVNNHSEYYLQLSEQTETLTSKSDQHVIIDRLLMERFNIAACLTNCHHSKNIETGLRICSAVWRLWQAMGELNEGRRWFEVFLSFPQADPLLRAKAYSGLAGLLYWQAQYDETLIHYNYAFDIYQDLGDQIGIANTLFGMSTTHTWNGQTAKGSELADQALQIFSALGCREKIGMVLMAKGFASWMEGDLDQAKPLWQESYEIAREVGDLVEAATKLMAIGSIKFQQGYREEALQDSLMAMEQLVELKNVTYTIMALDWIAAIAVYAHPRESVFLAGAAYNQRSRMGGGMKPESSGLKNSKEVALTLLPKEEVDEEWQNGLKLGYNEAIALAQNLAENVLVSQALC